MQKTVSNRRLQIYVVILMAVLLCLLSSFYEGWLKGVGATLKEFNFWENCKFWLFLALLARGWFLANLQTVEVTR